AAEARLDLPEKRGVEINLVIRWAIERPHRALSGPASSARATAEEDESRSVISFSVLREDILPDRLRAAQDAGDEAPDFIARRAGLTLPRWAAVFRPLRTRELAAPEQ